MIFLQRSLLFCLGLVRGVSSLDLKSYTACYGTTGWDNFLQINCGAEKIAPMGFYANAKLRTTNCPDTIDFSNKATTPQSCCEYDPADCEVFYRGSVYQAYYQQCNGKTQCNIQVSWVPTTSICNTSVYMDRTNYMKLDYYCVSSQALDTCTNFEATDSPTFLWNSGYPSSSMSGSGSCSCSVEVDCDTTIQITAIDLRFFDVGGTCRQSIQIVDGGATVTFGCGSNNEYLPTLLYTSSSHYIQISVIDNLGSTGGYYFLAIQGANPSGNIRLSCGSTLQSTASANAATLPECPGATSSSSSSSTQTMIQSSILLAEFSSEQTTTMLDTDLFSTLSLSTETVTLSMDPSTASTEISPMFSSSLEETGTLSVDDNSLRTESYTTMPSEITLTMSDSLISPTDTLSLDDTATAEFYTTMSTVLDTSAVYTANFSLTSDLETTGTPTLSHTDLYGSLDPTTTLDDSFANASDSVSDFSPSFASLNWSSTEGPIMSSAIMTPVCCKANADDNAQKDEGPPIWVAAVVVLVVIIGVVAMLVLYREKLKECLFKEKKLSESKEELARDEDEKTDLDHIDAFGTFVPVGKAGQLPPIQHSHPLQRENTMSKRPLSPIRFQMEKGKTTLDLKKEERLVGRRPTVMKSPASLQSKSPHSLLRKTKLPSLEMKPRAPADTKAQQQRGKKKKTKKKSIKGKHQPKVEHSTPVEEETKIEAETSQGQGTTGEGAVSSETLGRRKSLTAIIDLSRLNGSLERSIKIDMNEVLL